MPRVTIKHNLDSFKKTIKKLPENIDDAAEATLKKTAQTWKKNGITTLRRNGSNVTGTAENSFNVRKSGKNSYGVYGAAYLKTVDMGAPSHFPNISNYRFQEAARQYGIDQYALAATIARNGTKAHPWMQETTNRTNKTFGNRLSTEVSKAISESMR